MSGPTPEVAAELLEFARTSVPAHRWHGLRPETVLATLQALLDLAVDAGAWEGLVATKVDLAARTGLSESGAGYALDALRTVGLLVLTAPARGPYPRRWRMDPAHYLLVPTGSRPTPTDPDEAALVAVRAELEAARAAYDSGRGYHAQVCELEYALAAALEVWDQRPHEEG